MLLAGISKKKSFHRGIFWKSTRDQLLLLKLYNEETQNQKNWSSPPEVLLGKATLLKSHFGMGVLLQICCIFSEHLFLKTPMKGYFWKKQLSRGVVRFEKLLFWKIFVNFWGKHSLWRAISVYNFTKLHSVCSFFCVWILKKFLGKLFLWISQWSLLEHLLCFNSLVVNVSKLPHFKNLVANIARFLKCIWPFLDVVHWRV